MPGLIILKNLNRKQLWDNALLKAAILNQVGPYNLEVKFLNERECGFNKPKLCHVSWYDMKGIEKVLKLHGSNFVGKILTVELNLRKYGSLEFDDLL